MLREVEDWLLADGGLKAATVDETMRKVRQMVKEGFDVARFFKSPRSGRAELRSVVVGVKRAGRSGHTVRNFQKAANHLLRFASARWPRRFRQARPFDLDPEPKAKRERYSEAQVVAIRGYRHRFRFVCKRRRALLYLCEHTGLRRIELGRLQRRDLEWDGVRWWVVVREPAKEGEPRRVPLPHHPGPSRLEAYLVERDGLHGGAGALWVSRHPGARARALPPAYVSAEMMRISRDLGFALSPTRFRRTRAKMMRRAGVSGAAGARSYGQASERTFEKYAGSLDDADVLEAFVAAGLLGFAEEAVAGA